VGQTDIEKINAEFENDMRRLFLLKVRGEV
jgi:hypothetical protein